MALRLQNENTLHDRTATKSRHTAAEKATSQGKLLAVCDENVGKPVQRSSEELEACEQPIPNRVERPRTQNEIGPDNPAPPPNVEDIDADDSEYLEFCSDYVKHIYDHLFKNEALSPVEVDFLKKYPELSPRMRKMLIEWLVSLQSRFRLLQDTLMLSVSIMDRTLTAHRFKVNRANFQLLGATCLWIASKYEEMYCPSVRDFVYMCADSYTCLEFREMETRILTTLGFELSKPISSHFLRRFSKAGGGEFKTHTAAKYLIELSLYSYELAHCLPSLIAASALFVAGRATGVIVWDETMEFYSRYRSKTLKPVALKMAHIAAGVQKDAHLKTTLQKYSCEKFYMVPTLFTAKLLDELFPSGGTAYT